MTSQENIGEQLHRIEVQDQSPDPVPITVKKGLGQRALNKLGLDSDTLQDAGVIRAGEAQRAQDIAAEPNKAPSELSASPIVAERAQQLIENTSGGIKSYDRDASLLGTTKDQKLN